MRQDGRSREDLVRLCERCDRRGDGFLARRDFRKRADEVGPMPLTDEEQDPLANFLLGRRMGQAARPIAGQGSAEQ